MKKLLLVDDEKETAIVFETALRQAGYEVRVASSGQSAIDMAKAEQYDLILLDQMMPDISGNEALRQLKSDPASANIPVAMLTNFGHEEMVKESLNLGAIEYILKYQVSHSDLIHKVKRLLGEA